MQLGRRKERADRVAVEQGLQVAPELLGTAHLGAHMLASASERTVTAGDPNLGTEMPPGRPIHTDSHRPCVALSLSPDLCPSTQGYWDNIVKRKAGRGSNAAQLTTLIGSLAMSVQ